MVFTDEEVRKLISDFVYLLEYVVMDQEEVQLFISQWLRDPKSKGNEDFERLHGYLFETDNDVNIKDIEDLGNLK